MSGRHVFRKNMVGEVVRPLDSIKGDNFRGGSQCLAIKIFGIGNSQKIIVLLQMLKSGQRAWARTEAL